VTVHTNQVKLNLSYVYFSKIKNRNTSVILSDIVLLNKKYCFSQNQENMIIILSTLTFILSLINLHLQFYHKVE